MPVITRIITADSASRRNARSSEKSPAVIHVKSVWLIWRLSGAMCMSAFTWVSAITNEIAIISVASPPLTAFGSRFPRNALTRKPPNGSRGISASTAALGFQRSAIGSAMGISPFQGRERFGVERFAMPEQADHERETDRGFGGRHRHHEEGDDLAIDRAPLAPERDEREIDGVQHDLDRHQQRDQVAAQEHAGSADRKQ